MSGVHHHTQSSPPTPLLETRPQSSYLLGKCYTPTTCDIPLGYMPSPSKDLLLTAAHFMVAIYSETFPYSGTFLSSQKKLLASNQLPLVATKNVNQYCPVLSSKQNNHQTNH